MADDRQTDAARIEVERSRARLMGSAQQLQERLNPKTIARGAWEDAKEKGADIAEEAVDVVRARPAAAGGAAAALVLFLARGPLINLGKRIFGSKKKASKADRKRKSVAKDTHEQDMETIR